MASGTSPSASSIATTLLEPLKPRHAAEQAGQEPVIEQRLDRAHRLRRHEQPPELGRDPFRRKLIHAAAQLDRRPKPVRIERPLAVIGVEAEEAQDAQIVLFDARLGVADEAHPPRDEIGIAAKRIEHRAVASGIKRVEREVAPARVLLPILGEGDGRVPPERLDVAPQRRHLERHAVGNRP